MLKTKTRKTVHKTTTMKQIRKLKHRPTDAQTTGKTKTHTNKRIDEETHSRARM